MFLQPFRQPTYIVYRFNLLIIGTHIRNQKGSFTRGYILFVCVHKTFIIKCRYIYIFWVFIICFIFVIIIIIIVVVVISPISNDWTTHLGKVIVADISVHLLYGNNIFSTMTTVVSLSDMQEFHRVISYKISYNHSYISGNIIVVYSRNIL